MYNTVFDRIPEFKLRQIVAESTSIAQVFHKLKLRCSGDQYKTFKRRAVDELKIDLSHFNDKNGTKKFPIEIPLDEILVKGRFVSGGVLKNKIKKFNLFEYKCKICENKGIWNNKPISLQIDHIDGNNKNNEISNLRFLCPNCHSQTETFSGRKLIKIYFCQDCGEKVHNKKSKKCKKCWSKYLIENNICPFNRVSWPKNDELKKMVFEKPLIELCKVFSASINGIKKHCIKNNIDLPPQGYWQRIQHGSSHEDALKKKLVSRQPKKLISTYRNEVRYMDEKGLTYLEISKSLGFSRHTVSRFIKEMTKENKMVEDGSNSLP